jgi:tetratricopeptide (TPR) repeat protein
MNNLALTYSDLGRHADALDMQEKVLEFRLRELPQAHPDIGDVLARSWEKKHCTDILTSGVSMNNLAITYVALRRYDDALSMRKKLLEFFLRILPSDHPNIGDI